MNLKRLLPTVTAAVALAVAGCGSSDSDTGSSTPAAATPTPATGGAGAAIGLKGIAFNPKSITVKVGDKVTWTNQEPVDHNVTADSGAKFKSDDFGEGKTFQYTPTAAGTITYECTIHPGMNGTIIVQ